MNHFTLGEWADFVRHLMAPSVTTQMRQHLDGPCKRCSKLVRMWQDLFDFGSKEGLYRPPDRALRSVRGYYSLLKPGRESRRVATMARLIFDSLLEPLPAGVRSSQSSPRQLIYSAANFLVDMRLERRARRIHLVGQAQPRAGARARVAGINVCVLRGDETIAQTRSNRFGEFQFELDPSEENEEVTILLEGPTSAIIPLRSVGPSLGGGSKS
jgi:hypothetical protein